MTHTLVLDDDTVHTSDFHRTIRLEIWDTAGQERYRSLANMYYRGAKAAIVVYDITNRDSFNEAKYWINELYNKAPSNPHIVLAGNKYDLRQSGRAVSFEEAKAYADAERQNRLSSAKHRPKMATTSKRSSLALG